MITKDQCAAMELSCFDPPPDHPYDDSKQGHPREPIQRAFLTMLDSKTQKRTQGFSLLELMLVVAVIMILAAVSVPGLMKTVSDISLRYTASDLASLLQTTRMQAVKRNTFYSVQPGTLASGQQIYYMERPATAYAAGDPIMPVGPDITVTQGAGSGAPNETAFLTSLAFTVNASAAAPSFNARGLPCIATVAACPTNTTNGFVVFMSKNVLLGNSPWAAVVVNPSGRVQIWTSDSNGNWVQRN